MGEAVGVTAGEAMREFGNGALVGVNVGETVGMATPRWLV